MGFRFRRSIRLLPGVRVNLSKSGSSLSVGRRGATVNFSKRGTRATVGIPGTGISWSETAKPSPAAVDDYQGSPVRGAIIIVAILVAIGALIAFAM